MEISNETEFETGNSIVRVSITREEITSLPSKMRDNISESSSIVEAMRVLLTIAMYCEERKRGRSND